MPGTPSNTAAPNERRLSFWEQLYYPELFRGLAHSFRRMRGNLNQGRITYTLSYPEEQWYPPDSFRGRPVLVVENGQPRCVACGLCARACPPLAISMQAEEVDDPKERNPAWFEIDMLRCIYCGFCEEVCPEEAIVMSSEYDLTFQSREEAKFGLDRLARPVDQMKDRLEYLDRTTAHSPGSEWTYDPDNNHHSVRDRSDGESLRTDDDPEHRSIVDWLAGGGLNEIESGWVSTYPAAEEVTVQPHPSPS